MATDTDAQRTVPDRTLPPAAHPGREERSTSQLLGDIVSETQTLFRKEVELAKQEVMEAVSVRLQAAAAAAVGGLMALFALAFGAVTAAKALDLVVAEWLAWLIVFLGFVVIALIAFVVARSRANAVPMEPERTKRSIEENVQWARTRLRR